MEKKLNYFSFIILLLVLYLSFIIIKPFFGSILSALVISYLIYPIYLNINKFLKNKDLAIYFTIILTISVILIPLFLISYNLLDELKYLITLLRDFDENSISFIKPELKTYFDSYILPLTENLSLSILKILGGFLTGLPNKILSFIVFMVCLFLFLREGEEIIKKFKITIPLESKQKEVIFQEFQNVVKGIAYSTFLSSFLNGVITFIVFTIFGIPNSILWCFFSFILSFIPIISNSPVWIGGGIYLLLVSNVPRVILFALIGILSNQVINIITIKLVGKNSRLNSLLVLIGFVGGIKGFGLIGIVLGPLILSILLTLIKVYTKGFKESLSFSG
ncbi:MAG: AI-2E family transporter [Candidatus Aenigmatarchaeota archaeon]